MSKDKEVVKEAILDRVTDRVPENITIRMGNAGEIEAREPFQKATTIDGPRVYLKHRKPDKSKAIIVATDRSIELRTDPHRTIEYVFLSGRLIAEDKTQSLNTSEKYTPEELFKLIRTKGSLFTDKDVFNKLLLSLRNVNAKINRVLKEESNNRGDKMNLIETTVKSNVIDEFYIVSPLFKGCSEMVQLRVELILEVSSGGLLIELFMPEYQDECDRMAARLIETEITEIENMGYLVLMNP